LNQSSEKPVSKFAFTNATRTATLWYICKDFLTFTTATMVPKAVVRFKRGAANGRLEEFESGGLSLAEFQAQGRLEEEAMEDGMFNVMHSPNPGGVGGLDDDYVGDGGGGPGGGGRALGRAASSAAMRPPDAQPAFQLRSATFGGAGARRGAGY
jgi:hypothetical protein